MTPLLAFLACTAPSDEGYDKPHADDSGAAPDDSADTTDTDPPDTADTDDTDDTTETGDTDEDPDTAPVVPAPCDSWAEPRDMGMLADAHRDEVSGVAPSILNPGVLWILEDHGNDPAFYAIDVTGIALGTLKLEGVENVDWEAIALGPCPTGTCLWAADVGDNGLARTGVALYRVPEPEVGWGGGLDSSVVPERFPLVYAGSAVNVEAFLLTPEGLPVLLSKRGDGVSEVFIVDTLEAEVDVAPRLVGTFATREPDLEMGGMVTSADLWPDGSRLLVRTYEATWELDLGERGIEAVADATRVMLPFDDERQTEAVAYDTVIGGYWQIPEGPNAPISFVACLD